jgi:hypothetical protein
MAEREGFEPSVRVYPAQRFSKPPPSTTRPPLRIARYAMRRALPLDSAYRPINEGGCFEPAGFL